jgi:hypothetical protein
MKIHVEVFIASRILGQRQGTFTPEELKKFILTEFNDSRSGVQTHVSAECVANAPLNHAWPQLFVENRTWNSQSL